MFSNFVNYVKSKENHTRYYGLTQLNRTPPARIDKYEDFVNVLTKMMTDPQEKPVYKIDTDLKGLVTKMNERMDTLNRSSLSPLEMSPTINLDQNVVYTNDNKVMEEFGITEYLDMSEIRKVLSQKKIDVQYVRSVPLIFSHEPVTRIMENWIQQFADLDNQFEKGKHVTWLRKFMQDICQLGIRNMHAAFKGLGEANFQTVRQNMMSREILIIALDFDTARLDYMVLTV
jgi:hypothetical protein